MRAWGLTRLGLLAVGWLLCSQSATAEPPAAGPVDFSRDIRPIFAARCLSCHGEEQQESDLRLDRRDDALRGGAGGVVIVPKKATESSLVARIAGNDADTRMPPEGELLSKEDQAKIRAWIDQGATWPDQPDSPATKSDHWSLRPLVRPPIPSSGPPAGHPIDAFLAVARAKRGLSASPEADRRTLLRRVSVDLTGMLPTYEELQAFLADTAPDAYERMVDRLLASPRYGERWARHWMDVVHFAETHGNDQDRPRENAWPYRDYLIRSFNEDKPYPRFVAEQIAGDVLYPDDPQATLALGFLSAGPWDESSLMCIVDDTLDKKLAQLLDRDDMVTNVMSTFTSTTVHCARCHNHKFDPISQQDYYNLQAVFAGVDRADRPFDADPAVHRQRRGLAQEKRALAAADGAQLLADAELQRQVFAVEAALANRQEDWTVLTPTGVSAASGSTHVVQPDGSLLYGGTRPDKDTYTITLEADLAGVTAVRLEVLTDPSLPQQGPGRQDNGNLHLSEFKLSTVVAGQSPAPVRIASAFADFDQQGWGVSAAIDNQPATAWGIHPQVGQSHAAVFVLAQPLAAGPGQLIVELVQEHGRGHLIGRPRLSVTKAADPAAIKPLPTELVALRAIPADQRSTDQRVALTRLIRGWQLDAQLAALGPPQMVYAATHEFKGNNNFRPTDKPRPVHLLRRGDITQPLDEATPGGLRCVPDTKSNFEISATAPEGARRAALAGWLVDPHNVLSWRSIVNRIWHYHFDRGIVDTPNDLGHMGGEPSHPQLLDWLATEFRDSGGSLKALHRLMVTSAAYRQSSRSEAMPATIDAENRLLWRMNGRRLDAETIRDAVLAVSGRLDQTMGGPSERQFIQTPGIHVTPNVDYLTYDVDSPGNRRRSVYRFLFRTLPDPLMESLDCPDGSQWMPVRSQSVTALQALSLLDNRFIVRFSEHTAENLTAAAPSPAEQIKLLFRRALLRDPTEDESPRWEAYAARHGLANACRMMFNTNEFVFVN